MPIYAYRCSNCGHAQDVLQKISDPVLAVCPACGQSTYVKQVTAAGFQLKGSGWYVTDFRGDKKATGKPPEGGDADGKGSEKSAEKAGDSGSEKPAAEAKVETKNGEGGKKGEAAPTPAGAPSPAPAAVAPPPAPPGKAGS